MQSESPEGGNPELGGEDRSCCFSVPTSLALLAWRRTLRRKAHGDSWEFSQEGQEGTPYLTFPEPTAAAQTVRCPLITYVSLPKSIPSYTQSRLILTRWKPFPFLYSCDLRRVYKQDARVSAHATTSFVMMAVALTSRWLATEWSSVLTGLMKLSVKIVSHLHHILGVEGMSVFWQ